MDLNKIGEKYMQDILRIIKGILYTRVHESQEISCEGLVEIILL